MTTGGRAKGRGMQREYSVSVSPIGPNPKLSSLASLFQTVHIAAYFGILQRQTLHKHKDDYQRWKSHIAKSRENKFQQNPQQSCHLSGGCGFLSGIFKRWRSCPCLLQLHCECPSLGATELGLSTPKLPRGAHPTPDPLSCSPAPTYLGRLHFPKGTLCQGPTQLPPSSCCPLVQPRWGVFPHCLPNWGPPVSPTRPASSCHQSCRLMRQLLQDRSWRASWGLGPGLGLGAGSNTRSRCRADVGLRFPAHAQLSAPHS